MAVLLPRYVNVFIVVIASVFVVPILVKVVTIWVVEGAIRQIVKTEVIISGSIYHWNLSNLVHCITISVQHGGANELILIIVLSVLLTSLLIRCRPKWILIIIRPFLLFLFHCCFVL